VVGEFERLTDDHPTGLAGKELIHGLSVDDEATLARLQEDAGHCAFATPGTEILLNSHVRLLL
jgi:hypothetical protein